MKNMISRRNFLAAAGVVAAAGVLTACGGSSSTAASAAGSTAAAASGDTIKVGVMGPLSGNVSVYGQAVVNGAALYLKQVNANGGINGKQIEILTEDEQGDATQAVNCFTKMVDEGMTALIGDVTTTPTLAVVAESADYNMPMVTASATAEAVTYDAETDTVNANVFRATFTDPFQGIKMADYAYQKLGYTKAAVIFKKGADYNEGLAENFVNEFESLGGTIVDQESYSEGDGDFKTQLTTILGKDPETVFCPNYYEEVGQILSQAESVGLNVPFLGGDGWDGLEGYATADQLKDSYFCANYAKGSSPEFEDAYKAEYGEDYPNGFAPLGYDAAKTVVYGVQAAEDAGLEAGTDEYKQAVNDVVHPAVARDFEQSSYEWMESAILFDSGFYRRIHLDFVVCVTAPVPVRIQRIMQRDHIPAEKAQQWIDAVMPQEELAARSDFEIVNDGEQNIEAQVRKLLDIINNKE